jgi:ketosteroid isomerase-like protein
MASDDAEVVRRAWAAITRRDISATLDCMHPEIEAIPFGAAMEGRVYHGHEGVVTWLEREVWATYETFEAYADEIQEVGDRLLVFGNWVARGKESGVELDVPASWVVDVRDGKMVRWQTYTDRDEAIAAAGLKRRSS